MINRFVFSLQDTSNVSGIVFSLISEDSVILNTLQGNANATVVVSSNATSNISDIVTYTIAQGNANATVVVSSNATSNISDTFTSNVFSANANTAVGTFTLGTSIELCDYKPRFEMSFGLTSNSAYSVYRINNKDIFLYDSIQHSDNDLYRIIFRTLSNTTTAPVSVFKNNDSVLEGTSITGSTQFETASLRLFNINDGAKFSLFGLRSVIIYDGEPSLEQAEKINNLLRR